jgi:hypothetical protein
MIGESNVAIFARVVDAAALHLDRDNVSWSVIVFAARLRAELDPAHMWMTGRHTGFGNKRKSDRQQFFVEPANLPVAVDEVHLQYPMPLPAQ